MPKEIKWNWFKYCPTDQQSIIINMYWSESTQAIFPLGHNSKRI